MTFEELEFYPRKALSGEQARYIFPNGYGISVINGSGTYSSKGTYEVAILYDGHLTYNTSLTDDVLSEQTPKDIDTILSTIEKW